MKKIKQRSTYIALVGMLFLSGCLWTPEFSQILGEIKHQLPDAEIKKELQLSLGPASLGFARTVISLIDDEHDRELRQARSYLRDIRSVKVGIYDVRNVSSVNHLKMPRHIERLLKNQGWESAVKVRESNELVWALFRTHRESINELFVLTISRREIVMVIAEGRLNKLFEKVMEDHVDVGGLFTDI